MSFNESLSQLFYAVIILLAVLIAWEFYKSKDGKLRIIIIALFIAKVWVYGGAMIYHFLLDFGYIKHVDRIFVQLVLNFPMVAIMLRLWKFIRIKE